MIKINKNLALFSGLFFLSETVLFFTFQKFSPIIGHAAYYCQSFINDNMISIPYFFSIIPFILLSIILIYSLTKFLILNLKAHFLTRSLSEKIVERCKIVRLIKDLELEKKVIIIQSGNRFAFCNGIINPKIYISTELISELNKKELEAVLRHEQYHLENYDTFIMAFASFVRYLFFFFPLIIDIIKRYRIEREIQADNFAVKKIGDAYPLISALKKILTFPTVDTISLAAIADEDTLEPRIYSLLHKKYSRRQFRIRHVLITLLSIFILGAALIIPVNAKEIHHQDLDTMMLCTERTCMSFCASEENLRKLYSETPNTSKLYTPMKSAE